jgi:hypothetical protein
MIPVSRSKSLAICLLLAPIAFVLIGCGGEGKGSIKPDDKTPHPPPIDGKDDLQKKFEDDLKKGLGNDSAAVAAVNDQIAKVVGAGGGGTAVPVEIYFVDEAEFKKEFTDDGDPKATDEQKKARTEKAATIFSGSNAYTYIPPKNPKGHQKVKIKIFKKQTLNELLIDDKFLAALMHELVHAKLYAIGILGKELPFPDDHDSDRFKKEIEELLKKLK